MKKGFTLIELLAVITILSLLVLITSLTVANILKESKEELTKSQKQMIELAAKTWVSDNITKFESSNECYYLTLKDLKNSGLVEEKISNPSNNKEIPDGLKIKILYRFNNSGRTNISYEVDPNSVDSCTYLGSNIYVDVPKGLTPVVYDGNNWKVPESNEKWYDYDEQMWANAVVLGKGKTKKPGDIVTVEGENPDALMMLVYIPRYEYKIEEQYGIHYSTDTLGTQELPGEIKVKFINKIQTISDDDYIIHPAFKFGNDELSGIWVGKFEISHTTLSGSTTANNLGCSSTICANADGLRILPGVSSLRYNDVSNFFYGIRSIENKTNVFGLSNMDTHMMKNSECGAVAYLSQSKYGKYGNSDYDGVQKEVYINNSSSFYTGRSGGNPGGNTAIKDTYTDQTSTTDYNQYGYYTYDGYLLSYNTNNKTKTRDINKGAGASTTGNIYGVYDMSGGASEYVMGAYGTEKNPILGDSGFSPSDIFTNDTINTKYYDVYTNLTDSESYDETKLCNNDICFGHAISETKGWYKDYLDNILSNKWLLRGGLYNASENGGVFARSYSGGSGNELLSSRFVGVSK